MNDEKSMDYVNYEINLEKNTLFISENNRSQIFLEGMCQQWKEERFCDIILHVGNENLKAHRCVLATASTYFSSILKGILVMKCILK